MTNDSRIETLLALREAARATYEAISDTSMYGSRDEFIGYAPVDEDALSQIVAHDDALKAELVTLGVCDECDQPTKDEFELLKFGPHGQPF